MNVNVIVIVNVNVARSFQVDGHNTHMAPGIEMATMTMTMTLGDGPAKKEKSSFSKNRSRVHFVHVIFGCIVISGPGSTVWNPRDKRQSTRVYSGPFLVGVQNFSVPPPFHDGSTVPRFPVWGRTTIETTEMIETTGTIETIETIETCPCVMSSVPYDARWRCSTPP